MPRLLFEKTGNAIWISHLDLMRVFQRAFKRAGLPLTHTHGFNPRPSVSIALPLSVGIESRCELLDFDLDYEGPSDWQSAREKLNQSLISGVRVLEIYDSGRKIKDLSYLKTKITMEFDKGIPENFCNSLNLLLNQDSLIVQKKNKNGIQDQDIIPMILEKQIHCIDSNSLAVEALVCCQNPTLNPMQIIRAVERYLPQYPISFAKCSRIEIFDKDRNIFR